jgi:Resolvase, N terminal domain
VTLRGDVSGVSLRGVKTGTASYERVEGKEQTLQDSSRTEVHEGGRQWSGGAEQTAGLEAQGRDLLAAGVERLFSEKTSAVGPRRELEAALDFAREGDTLVVTKLDRLARSVADLVRIAEMLTKKGVGLRERSVTAMRVFRIDSPRSRRHARAARPLSNRFREGQVAVFRSAQIAVVPGRKPRPAKPSSISRWNKFKPEIGVA